MKPHRLHKHPAHFCPMKTGKLKIILFYSNTMSGTILPFTEANSKRVASLFRQALRTAYDHSLKFDAYRAETIKIRAEFDANKSIDNVEKLEQVIAETKARLAYFEHPDPYISPCRPGGTKYQRNIPVERGPLVPGDW